MEGGFHFYDKLLWSFNITFADTVLLMLEMTGNPNLLGDRSEPFWC